MYNTLLLAITNGIDEPQLIGNQFARDQEQVMECYFFSKYHFRRSIHPLSKKLTVILLGLTVSCFNFLCVGVASAALWSSTEIHYQRGEYDNPYSGGTTDTTVLTFQHASGWKYGSNFFFVDQLSSSGNEDFYGEMYSTFSLGKMTGRDLTKGTLTDVGIVLGINVAGDPNVRKYLPGLNLSWKVPGFNYFDTLLTLYIDDTAGDQAPKEDDSFMIDWAWDYPFSIGSQEFNITGHMEYVHQRDNEFGGTVESWILAQPQLRYDLGHALFDVSNQLLVGIEYQFWLNKLGDSDTDEKTALVLVVWQL